MRQTQKTVLVWVMMALAFVVAYELILGARSQSEKRPSFSDFMQAIEKTPTQIENVRIDGQEYVVSYKKQPPDDKVKLVWVESPGSNMIRTSRRPSWRSTCATFCSWATSRSP